MSNYDQRGQKNYGDSHYGDNHYGDEYYAEGDMHHYYPNRETLKSRVVKALFVGMSRIIKALFVGTLHGFLWMLFADVIKFVFTFIISTNIPHSATINIVQFSYPLPFYIGIFIGIIGFLYYLVLGDAALQTNRRR